MERDAAFRRCLQRNVMFEKALTKLAGQDARNSSKEMKTRITELLGIEHPIFQAAMSWASSNAPLVIAVSNAGGMAVLGAGPMRPADFRNVRNERRPSCYAAGA